MKRILISIPNQHWIHKLVVHKVMFMLSDGRYKVSLTMPSHKPYVNNLHHIVKEFLEKGYDFWLNIDADNPPQNNPLDLVRLNKDIIGLPTPIWYYTGGNGSLGERPVYWNVYDYVSSTDAYTEHNPKKGLQRVDAVGTGCLLIKREVFEDPVMQQGAFFRKWDKRGLMTKGNDIAFCERARNRGFEIYAHYDYPCGHVSELELDEVTQAFDHMHRGVND